MDAGEVAVGEGGGADPAAVAGDHVDDPRGRPAASRTCISTDAASCWVVAGFQTTVLPMSAGAVGRLPAIEVKLKGVMASTKPSSGRESIRFHTPGGDRLLSLR